MENRPFNILDSSLNRSVMVKLKGGIEIRGVMSAYDVHMNIVLENAEQLENGEVKRKLGRMLIRGDSIIFLTPSE
jgi:small nuclear ribonucleoprotein